jgi:CubicO group peptidase (beta-lactamase class C family)
VTAEDLDGARAELQALGDHYATTHHSPALVWGVMLDGQLALSGYSGALDDGAPPTTSTVFRIASMTKPITAATVLRLRDDGIVALDDAITELAAARPTADSPAITLRHLLSMQAGITSDDPWADRHLDIGTDELDAVIAAGPRFAVVPGTGWEYSNLGYGLIGRVLARVTGERPQDVIDRVLIAPLALARTAWTQPDHEDWARPYRVEDGRTVADDPPLGDGAMAPMGGLWSTIEDVVQVMSFFDDAFPARDADDDGPLRRASRREMQQVHRAVDVAFSPAGGDGLDHVPERIDGGGYGFGLQVIHDQRFAHIVGHSGGLPGYGSNMRWLPGRRVGAVALANSTYAPMRLLTRRMLEVLDEHGLVPPVVAPVSPALQRAAADLLALVNDWSDEAAAALFADNVALDEPFERRARRAGEVVTAHGKLTVERIAAKFATDGTMTARAADGREVQVWLALSPHAATRVQDYSITVTS